MIWFWLGICSGRSSMICWGANMRKLKLWHRLGIVISLLWMVSSGLWQYNTDQQIADTLSFTTFQGCKDTPLPEPARGAVSVVNQCATDMQSAHDSVMDGSWNRVADIAIFPILLGWPIAYLVLWVATWILAGRKNKF